MKNPAHALALLVLLFCAPALAQLPAGPARAQPDPSRAPADSRAQVDALRAQVDSLQQQIAAAQARTSGAPAQTARAADGGEDQLREFVERAAGPGARVEVKIGRPGAPLQLAPCDRMEPFLPAGVRLWGRGTLGVRCVQGASWQAMLPVEVRIFSQAPVAARALSAGEGVSPADMVLDEVELTRYPVGAIADPASIGAKVLVRPVGAGQPLLAAWFRARPVIGQGDTVKVVYAGKGFSVSAEGRAMQQGLEGSRVRVQLDSGRNVTGIARDGRIVELTH